VAHRHEVIVRVYLDVVKGRDEAHGDDFHFVEIDQKDAGIVVGLCVAVDEMRFELVYKQLD
jgi:hypothetical protein